MAEPHRARKRFGQHFLHDPAVLARLVAAIRPRPGERLVEIGPGLGALTRPLLQATGRLDVVELDRDVVPHLREACADLDGLHVHLGDALRFDYCALADGEANAGETPDAAPLLRVVGNLPYNISTPLLFHLIGQAHCIRDMHFMLQKEVVDRIVAGAGDDAYGRLGIMVQFHCAAERLFTIRPGAFNPPPKVDSAVVRLVPHRRPPVTVKDFACFSQIVTQAFSQRRKTLRNALKGLLDAEAITAADIDPGLRPERIDLAGFARLADALAERLPDRGVVPRSRRRAGSEER